MFMSYDDASARPWFHYVVTWASGGILETRDVAYGPQDIGWELEVLKSSPQDVVITVPASNRWLAKRAIATARGAALLLGGSETKDGFAFPCRLSAERSSER
jgi:hypothetical protein